MTYSLWHNDVIVRLKLFGDWAFNLYIRNTYFRFRLIRSCASHVNKVNSLHFKDYVITKISNEVLSRLVIRVESSCLF